LFQPDKELFFDSKTLCDIYMAVSLLPHEVKGIVATPPLALRWMRGSPRTECARRTTPYVGGANKQRVISSSELYCCLLSQCEALRTWRSGFPIATLCWGYFCFSWTRL